MQRYYHPNAVEFHGGDSYFLNNLIHSYGAGVIASENFIEPWENLLISNNIASDLGRDFVMTAVGTGPDTKPIDKIIVRGNHVVFNDNTSIGFKAGLTQAHGKPISYIEVSDNYFEMASPSSVIWPIGVLGEQINFNKPESIWYTFTTHLKVSGNTFNKMEYGVWVDNFNFHDQVRNLEYVNNTCIDMQDLNTALPPQAAGLWANGTSSQHIENFVVTGNRFINEANNAGYMYGVVVGGEIDNLHIGADNVFYNIKARPVEERLLIFNQRGPVIETSLQYGPKTVSAGSLLSDNIVVTGAIPGDLGAASFSSDLQGMVLFAVVNVLNTVKVTFNNYSTSDVTVEGMLFIRVSKKTLIQ